MSLDVYLTKKAEEHTCDACHGTGIIKEDTEVYWANITHNLHRMAEEAGIYNHLWRPEECGITKAIELIAPLAEGLARMKANPEHYKQFDSPNGWGTYENFVPWIEKYLKACIENQDAEVRVSR